MSSSLVPSSNNSDPIEFKREPKDQSSNNEIDIMEVINGLGSMLITNNLDPINNKEQLKEFKSYVDILLENLRIKQNEIDLLKKNDLKQRNYFLEIINQKSDQINQLKIRLENYEKIRMDANSEKGNFNSLFKISRFYVNIF